MSPILQEELVDLWDAVIPKLLKYLDGMNTCNMDMYLHDNDHNHFCYFSIILEHSMDESWDQKHWEDLILKVT